jgi:hypothetical protein
VMAALDDWRPLLEDHPRIARPVYSWKRESRRRRRRARPPTG